MKAWTGREERQVISMYREGLTMREIAERIGRTKSAVQKRVYYFRSEGIELEPRQSKWTPEEITTLLFLYQQGAAVVEIVDEIGRSSDAIRTMLKEMRRGNIQIPYRRIPIRGRKDVV